MKAAYADPPYLGCAKKHYGKMHANASDYDNPKFHKDLIDRLCDEFDCWALSLNEPSLRDILPMCPDGVRVAAWVKPFASFKPNVTRAYTWEPVIFSFHRQIERSQATWRDHIAESITLKKGFTGAKPKKFSYWIFEGLNLSPGDEFTDVFPGSGAVSDAFLEWKREKFGAIEMDLT